MIWDWTYSLGNELIDVKLLLLDLKGNVFTKEGERGRGGARLVGREREVVVVVVVD